MNSVELFGYFSSCLVLFSMMMKDMWMLRIINSIACACFVVYGVFIDSAPIMAMNFAVILVNVYKLYLDSKK